MEDQIITITLKNNIQFVTSEMTIAGNAKQKDTIEEKADKASEYLNLKGTPGEKFVKKHFFLKDVFKDKWSKIYDTLVGSLQGAALYDLSKKYQKITGITPVKAERVNAIVSNMTLVAYNAPAIIAGSIMQEQSAQIISETGENIYTLFGAHALCTVGYNIGRLVRNAGKKEKKTLPSITPGSLLFHTQYISETIYRQFKTRVMMDNSTIPYTICKESTKGITDTFKEADDVLKSYMQKTGTFLEKYTTNGNLIK